VQRYSTFPIKHTNIDLIEIQSLDAKEVVTHKANEAYRILQKPVLVEDTSLVIHALGRLPGTFIKWFHQELGSSGLCSLLSQKNNSASTTVLFCFYDGKTHHYFSDTVAGTIAKKPKGTNGFGWNNIFIPDGYNKTFAEMTDEELESINPRIKALEKICKVFMNL
jgi:XTP/dITP diphosphohydrolase